LPFFKVGKDLKGWIVEIRRFDLIEMASRKCGILGDGGLGVLNQEGSEL